MNILFLNTSDTMGGAARAAHRLYTGLREEGVAAQMLVQHKTSHDPHILRQQTRLDRQVSWRLYTLTKKYNTSTLPWSPNWVPTSIPRRVRQLNPDLVHLHWTGHGFLSIQGLRRLNKPLVWTLHDMWAFTGGCHYTDGCGRYQQQCGACPQLNSHRERDLSRWLWGSKRKQWHHLNMTIVCPSQWLASCAKESPLLGNFRVEVIPNGLDLTQFRPFDKAFARDVFGLPQDKKLILFGAMSATSDPRKGFQYLVPALEQLAGKPEYEAVVFGHAPGEHPPVSMPFHGLGMIQDDRVLALLYSAADCFVAPSTQDNLPNTVMESLACGTPCVAFHIGGMPDMISHQQNGYLAKPFVVDDLVAGINWVLADGERHEKISQYARRLVEKRFELGAVVRQYRDLYTDILSFMAMPEK